MASECVQAAWDQGFRTRHSLANKHNDQRHSATLSTHKSTPLNMLGSSRDLGATRACHILDLPVEVYAYLALKIAVPLDLEATFNLIQVSAWRTIVSNGRSVLIRLAHESQTCKALYGSSTGQEIRYLWALRKNNCVPSRAPPRPIETLSIEADRLLRSSWPPISTEALEPHWPLEVPELLPQSLIIDGVFVSGISRNRSTWLSLATRARRRSGDEGGGVSNEMYKVASFDLHQRIDAFDVDFDEGVAVLASISGGRAVVVIVDVEAGTEVTPRIERAVDEGARVEVEVLGPHLLLRAGGHIGVYQWKAVEKTASNEDKASPLPTLPRLLWSRDDRHDADSDDEPIPASPHLTAHLLGLDIVVVLSAPASSDHGLDWGSTLEFYKFTEQHSPHVADVQLPIRAKPRKSLSYVKTGLGKRLKSPRDDALIVVCVEGFIWVGDLAPFMDLLFPQKALALWGAGHPTLDSHWSRAHMHKCSLASLDACPGQPVSVSGWRIAALWSRAARRASDGADTPTHTASPSLYLRLLQADPRFDQEASKVTSRDQRPDLVGAPLVHTMYVSQRFYSYCDHLVQSQGGEDPDYTRAVLDGARLLVANPAKAYLAFI